METASHPILFSRDFGTADHPPLVILHGLMGSSRNWLAAARDLSAFAHVHLLDLRNHGLSFHDPEHGYDLMSQDVLRWMDHHGLPSAHILGHSMGGKLAMQMACRHPERLPSVIVVENAPRQHPPYFEKEVRALLNLALPPSATRSDLESELQKEVPDWALRKFLLSNLVRDEESGEWSWQPNITALYQALEHLSDNPLLPNDRYGEDALFIMGGNSDFIPPKDRVLIPHHFPASRLIEIPLAGHNPHFDQRETFVKSVHDFLHGSSR